MNLLSYKTDTMTLVQSMLFVRKLQDYVGCKYERGEDDDVDGMYRIVCQVTFDEYRICERIEELVEQEYKDRNKDSEEFYLISKVALVKPPSAPILKYRVREGLSLNKTK
jgi:hypothetical protein